MERPIILLTTAKNNLAAAWNEGQQVKVACNINYVESVIRAGGAPMLLPRNANKEVIQALMNVAHGVLLTGGGDIVSLNYGEEPHPTTKWADPVRDEMELTVIRLAEKRHMPILGICRGIQILNVAHGGTLIQDIPTQVPGACRHSDEDVYNRTLSHTVDIEPDSLASKLMGVTTTTVNSFHHQAVKDLGNGLKVTAKARDGVIEAVESTENEAILAVQWHPEEMSDMVDGFAAMFRWIVDQAVRFREKQTVETDRPSDVKNEPDTPIQRMAQAILHEAVGRSAVEIDIEPGEKDVQVRINQNGKMERLMSVPKYYYKELIDVYRSLAGLDVTIRSEEQNGSFSSEFNGSIYQFVVRYQTGLSGDSLYIAVKS